MTYKNKRKGKNFLDAVYSVLIATNVNVQEEASLNSLQNAQKRNPRIYINYILCPYYQFL